ncbi:MOSC domain-containing protein YiiM [Haloactinospora alba]|uniref:MOSC domain-containing protein YiiM n=1 Tax=Haloactinospora alba TaxID=405555 RepID=A0A543NGS5_9ACTN|nr:MOSC domain-containing protein [Haloactinospora alba]TQN31058.1 MOSC domain-containing protein YiiM [Haloactinospora alba]
MAPPSVVRSVNVGRVAEAAWAGRLKRTAIDKTPVTGRVGVYEEGVAGDSQADLEHHGGRDQAVYAYPREGLDRWEERLGRRLGDGAFGENLTTAGLDVNAALIGERWRVGTVLLEATLPRTPCGVFQAWLAEAGWTKRFTEEGRTGVYLRVLEEGSLAAGDGVTVVHRPAHGITVMAAFRAYYERDLDLLRRVLRIPGRSPSWERTAAQLERQLSNG